MGHCQSRETVNGQEILISDQLYTLPPISLPKPSVKQQNLAGDDVSKKARVAQVFTESELTNQQIFVADNIGT